MSDHKDESCSSQKCSCGCGCGCRGDGSKKFLIGLLVGAFIFASGMWFAKSSCSGYAKAEGGMKMCPISSYKADAK